MTFRHCTSSIAALLTAIALPHIAFAQGTASPIQAPSPNQAPSNPAPAASARIETAPYIALRLNMTNTLVPSEGAIIAPGQIVSTYNVSPRTRAKTLAASTSRIGTFPNILPANALLYQVGLEGIDGYCAVRSPGQGERQSQCFIDVNNDGKFDASYITNRAWHGQSLYWGQASKLASIPPLAFEPVTSGEPVGETFTYFFKRVRNQKAEFQISFGPRNNGLPVLSCALQGSPCRLGGHVFVFEASGAGVKVISVTEASEEIDIVFDR
jgi:hypothetical protein